MSIRRRNINSRLSRDLELEKGSHRLTRGLLDARGMSLSMALDERDAARRERNRLMDLAAELARYFHSDPPAALSRESDLFLLLREVAPGKVWNLPPPPPTPSEFVEAVVQMVGPDALTEIAATINADSATQTQEK